jgi:hypothetical protein
MENTVSPAKSGIPYGALFGVIMVLEIVITYVIGMKALAETSFGVVINILNFLILPLAFIYIGCTNYKNKLNGGFISFGECLKIGVTISLIAAIIYASFSIFFNLIFPEFVEETMAIAKSTMLKQNPNMSSQELEMGISMMKKFANPLIVFPVTLAMYSFLGLIHSLIIGAVVKNPKP